MRGESDEPPQSQERGEPVQPKFEIRMAPGVQHRFDLNWLRSHLADALRVVAASTGRPLGEIEVLITNDAGMIELNRSHAQADHTTDVLSFDLSDNQPGSPIEAEIAVCADEAARRAAELGHPIERELLLYNLHGLLHCAGFDDQTPEQYQEMHAEEDRILQMIGVGATFNSVDAADLVRQDAGGGGDVA